MRNTRYWFKFRHFTLCFRFAVARSGAFGAGRFEKGDEGAFEHVALVFSSNVCERPGNPSRPYRAIYSLGRPRKILTT